jgi:pimeloyl-ACP methyl ester carboxylesterase
MCQIELSAGRIDYRDTGGTGPTLVLLHGLLPQGRLVEILRPIRSAPRTCSSSQAPASQVRASGRASK